MSKYKNVKVLVVDRPLKPNESLMRNIYNVYRNNGYDIFIFPPSAERSYLQVILFGHVIYNELKNLFEFDYKNIDEEGMYYDFNLDGFNSVEFSDILSQEFVVKISNLTHVEKYAT